jgi:chemotaxis protein methyltransferase CheR
MGPRMQMKHTGHMIFSFFQNTFGFHLDEDKKKHLKRLLTSRIKKNGLTNEKDYLDLICSQGGKSERQFMIAAFTVGETYFYRNTNHWEALKHKIIPEIMKKKRQSSDKTLRIWSAACSSGEESYTIAIVVSESLSCYQTWDIDILATDINEASLNHARKGIYTENSFRDVCDDFKEKYFLKRKGKYKIQSHYKKMITFEPFNLINQNGFPKHYSNFDIIFCRNVLMYFSPEIAKNIMGNLYHTLNDDGYLLLGHTEGPITKDFQLKPLSFYNSIVYQKKCTGENIQSQLEPPKRNPLHQVKKINENHHTKIENKQPRKQLSTPVRPKNYYAAALDLYSVGRIDDAQQMLNKHNENQTLSSLLLVGLIYIHKKNINAAQVIFKEAQLIYDLTPETQMFGAMIHEEMNNLQEAINGCRRAIFLDPNFFFPHFRLGEIYRQLGDQEKMKKSFKNALKNLYLDNSDRLKLFCLGFSKDFLADYLKSI